MGEDGNTVTYTVDKDGTIVAKDKEGKETRFVKESDLLAVKGSKETLESQLKDAQAKATGGAELKTELESTRQAKLQAEAKVSTLTDQLAAATTGSAEATVLKQQLEAAKRSGEALNAEVLEVQRTLILATYGVPKVTVEKKNLAELKVYAEALAAVTGKALGNYAAGGGGGSSDFKGKSPIELARMAYENSNIKK